MNFDSNFQALSIFDFLKDRRIIVNNLNKQVALITGASRGVGAEIARKMGDQGIKVCVNYFQQKEKANKIVDEIISNGGQAFSFQADVRNQEAVRMMVQEIITKYGRIDIVVNNALPKYEFNPNANYCSIDTIIWENFQVQFDGVVGGVINTTKEVLPFMKKQNNGRIINISTNLVYNPVVTYYDYTTAKSALIGLTRSLASELGKYGIKVNLLAGGLLSVTDASSVTTEEVFNYIANSTPLRKVTTVSDFASSVLLFCTNWSDAITGQSISIDGGLTMP
jgi:3-oxoacyl-[acyl-carrier protein] reductase